ncbi:MAG: response regulator transcription factor [Acetatifactor sp.]|nr:response regulator transcription factor [Acetatifactor sp.]
MIRIALCDDEVSTLNEMQDFLGRYCRERNREIVYTSFCSPLELLNEIERGVQFDILFLDVLMPGHNGIETAADIRGYDSNIKIIFLTSSAEFAVQSYTVGAYFYQLKPLRWEIFSQVMDSALEKCTHEQENSLILQCKGQFTRIELRQLEFCEVIHRTLLFHLISGKILESTGRLDELSRKLSPYNNFLRIHRSYIVNLDYVQSISYRAVTMTSLTKIPIPRGKYNEVKDLFLGNAFRNGEVKI